jgi:hypothetical protein
MSEKSHSLRSALSTNASASVSVLKSGNFFFMGADSNEFATTHSFDGFDRFRVWDERPESFKSL